MLTVVQTRGEIIKKNPRKLTLNRETLRNLSNTEELAAVGAATGDTSCRCKLETGCECYTNAGCTLTCAC